MKKLLYYALVLASAGALLSACSSPATRTDATGTLPIVEAGTDNTAVQVSETTPLLETASNALLTGRSDEAASILREIAPGKLIPDDLARYALASSRLLYIDGDLIAAQASLEMALQRAEEISPLLRWDLHWQQLQLMGETAGALYSAQQADQLLAITGDPERRVLLTGHIWKSLQGEALAPLESARQQSTDARWRGWLELALIDGQALASPEQQTDSLNTWLTQYPEHPAAATLPGGLASIPELASSRPLRVSLILPLSGRLRSAGGAVLDGYLAAYYESLGRGWRAQQITVLDSTLWGDINQAYQAAVDTGAELVIGPLTKQELATWQRIELPIPILTLNHFQIPPLDNRTLYQFGLAPADEARQLAELAFQRGGRKALLIRPAGAWGASMAGELSARWSELNGELYATAVYAERDDYSSSLQTALGLDKSEQRASEIRQLLGTDLEFQPRRRQDIDSVFLLSGQPDEARAIKPLLSFHYAGELPVYSTSHIFSGRRDPVRDRDLNGIALIEIPWLLMDDSPIQQAVNANGATESLSAMYALGADAFLLHWRLPQLAESPGNRLRGFTGLLSMDQQGILHRQLVPARIEAGVPVAAGSGD